MRAQPPDDGLFTLTRTTHVGDQRAHLGIGIGGLTGLPLTDLTSGFRCYRGPALTVLASSEATLLDYQDVGTLLLLRSAQLRIVEVPVKMNPRVVGISRIFNSWFSVGRYMAVTTLLCLSRWRVPNSLRSN